MPSGEWWSLGAAATELLFDMKRLDSMGEARPRGVNEGEKNLDFTILVDEFEGGEEMTPTSDQGLFGDEAQRQQRSFVVVKRVDGVI